MKKIKEIHTWIMYSLSLSPYPVGDMQEKRRASDTNKHGYECNRPDKVSRTSSSPGSPSKIDLLAKLEEKDKEISMLRKDLMTRVMARSQRAAVDSNPQPSYDAAAHFTTSVRAMQDPPAVHAPALQAFLSTVSSADSLQAFLSRVSSADSSAASTRTASVHNNAFADYSNGIFSPADIGTALSSVQAAQGEASFLRSSSAISDFLRRPSSNLGLGTFGVQHPFARVPSLAWVSPTLDTRAGLNQAGSCVGAPAQTCANLQDVHPLIQRSQSGASQQRGGAGWNKLQFGPELARLSSVAPVPVFSSPTQGPVASAAQMECHQIANLHTREQKEREQKASDEREALLVANLPALLVIQVQILTHETSKSAASRSIRPFKRLQYTDTSILIYCILIICFYYILVS